MWDLTVSVPDHCLSFYFAMRYFECFQCIPEVAENHYLYCIFRQVVEPKMNL